MFVLEILAHYFSNWSGIRDWKFIKRYLLRFVLLLHCQMLSPKEYYHFCGAFFPRRGSLWTMKRWRCYCIFDQMLTKARNDMEALLNCFWQRIPMVPSAKENTTYWDTLTHKSKNLLKKPITMLLPFLIQLSRKIAARPEDLPLGQFSDDEWSSEDEF